jgi:hypothetical protein
MSLKWVLLRSVYWVCLSGLGILWTIFVFGRYRVPTDACVAVAFLAFGECLVLRDWIRWYLARPGRLKQIGADLENGGYWRQQTACFLLSVVVGNRFGLSHRRSRELWRQWWQRESDSLVWVDGVQRFVEQR